MKNPVAAFVSWRLLLAGLVLATASALVGATGCILGPKQDDPVAASQDSGGIPASDTSVGVFDGAASDTGGGNPSDTGTAAFDGCGEADADGGDAIAHDAGEAGCADGGRDADADAPDGEGGSDATGG